MSYDFHDIIRNGTQVEGSDDVLNATVDLYTVPAGKTLYMDYADLDCSNASGAEQTVTLEIRTAVPATHAVVIWLRIADATNRGKTGSFPALWKVPAGYSVSITSPAAAVRVRGSCHGWVI